MALIKNLIKRLFLMDWDAPEKRLFRFFFYALAILLPMIWVGDCSFLQDQALLLNNAWADNQKGGITQYGLMGTRGLHYGPFATYFYRLILLISTDFKTIFLLKIFIFQSLLLAGVLWWRKLFKTFNFEYVLYCLFSFIKE